MIHTSTLTGFEMGTATSTPVHQLHPASHTVSSINYRLSHLVFGGPRRPLSTVPINQLLKTPFPRQPARTVLLNPATYGEEDP